MMEYKNIAQLKSEGLQSLKGKWGIAILVCLIAGIITGGFSISARISTVSDIFNEGFFSNLNNIESLAEETVGSTILLRLSTLVNLLIGGSISYGLNRFFLNLTRNENPQVENLFSGFKYFGKNFLIQLIIGIFSALWALLVYIPVIIISVIILVVSFSSYPNLTELEQLPWTIGAGAIGLIVVLVIICSIIVSIIVLRYALAYYIYNDNKDAGVMDCINHSKEMMKGNKGRMFLLNLSYIGWHILSLLTLGIGYVWLRPYIFATTASFYNNLKQKLEPEDRKAVESTEWKEI
ncbi:DUF975 family protein [Clostridium bovifaecis]|uniref:DUF975 family protein n=1 Tax=Clostridium bovifaecis TaxID=2184719 RepID=A0A6I6F022_9CLOT|nr:DUF975 family protein [Clostridium bovifaecis]